MSTFSETIRRIRFEKHMTQDEFAELLGTTKQNISRYETGAVSPKIKTAAAIAEKLGITLSELNGGEPEQSAEDRELWQIREDMRRNPELRTLYDLQRKATKAELKQMQAFIRAIRSSNEAEDEDPA